MAETVAALRDAIVEEASFDVTPATALSWLNRSWREFVGRARAYRLRVAGEVTVADEAFYPFSGHLELIELSVAGVPYARAHQGDVYADSQDRLSWTGQGERGLFVPSANDDG